MCQRSRVIIFIEKLYDRWRPHDRMKLVRITPMKMHTDLNLEGLFCIFDRVTVTKTGTNLTFLFRNIFLKGTINVLITKMRALSLCPPALNQEFKVAT